jgi:integrase
LTISNRNSKARSLPKGIRQVGGVLQAYVTVRGRFHSKTFPSGTPVMVLKDWRERTRAEWKYGTPKQSGRSFADDAADYMRSARLTIRSQTTRQHDINAWVEVFGPRQRASITAAEITDVLLRWRTNGRHDGQPLKPGTVNGRRAALMAMYRSLDGKAHPNVVKDTPRFDASDSAQLRAVPLLTLAMIIRQTRPHTLNRARLRVLMWTGWPNQLLKGITPADIDWQHSRVRLPARKKGKGQPSAWVPVLPRALAALRIFHKLKAYGDFLNDRLFKAWKVAQAKANAHRDVPLPHIRVYDIRHSFLTWAASIVKDDRAMKELARSDMIERYTLGSELDRMSAAMQVLQVSARHRATLRHIPSGEQRAKPKQKDAS